MGLNSLEEIWRELTDGLPGSRDYIDRQELIKLQFAGTAGGRRVLEEIESRASIVKGNLVRFYQVFDYVLEDRLGGRDLTVIINQIVDEANQIMKKLQLGSNQLTSKHLTQTAANPAYLRHWPEQITSLEHVFGCDPGTLWRSFGIRLSAHKPPTPEDLGTYRELHNLSTQDIDELLKFPRKTVERFENGKEPITSEQAQSLFYRLPDLYVIVVKSDFYNRLINNNVLESSHRLQKRTPDRPLWPEHMMALDLYDPHLRPGDTQIAQGYAPKQEEIDYNLSGADLRVYRVRRNLTLEQLAKALAVPPEQLNKREQQTSLANSVLQHAHYALPDLLPLLNNFYIPPSCQHEHG